MPLSPAEAANLAEFRLNVSQRAEAHTRAAAAARARVLEAVEHLQHHNYGMAQEALYLLAADLPHDYGAQTFYPLFDEALAQVRP